MTCRNGISIGVCVKAHASADCAGTVLVHLSITVIVDAITGCVVVSRIARLATVVNLAVCTIGLTGCSTGTAERSAGTEQQISNHSSSRAEQGAAGIGAGSGEYCAGLGTPQPRRRRCTACCSSTPGPARPSRSGAAARGRACLAKRPQKSAETSGQCA